MKRATAVPGDPVPRGEVPALRDVEERCVPTDRFVVVGDNAGHSYDSRHYGYVEAGQLLGVVLRRLDRSPPSEVRT